MSEVTTSLFNINRPDFLVSGERARLIPVIADTSKEGRITSCTLAALMSVDEFAKGLLNSIGVKYGKTSKIECFTEVVFKHKDKSINKLRPDGLIILTTGKKQWKALIETKIGKAELRSEQIESYLELAKEHKIDSVITLSNQFCALPTHHPVNVNKNKIRSVALFHWSWTYLITEAVMWVKYHGITDPDQAYILEELIRYLQHNSSGVLSFDRMNGSWKDICSSVQNRIPLKKSSQDVTDSVASWHQFARNISLHLGLAIGENVSISIKKLYRNDAKKRLNDDVLQLVSDKILSAEFEIPDTAGKIKFTADIETRSIAISMRLKAPEERSTAKGRINWFINQLKKTSNQNIYIRAIWPGRVPDTMASLEKIRQEGIELVFYENSAIRPSYLEAVLVCDLNTKFKGAKTFIQASKPLLLEFYEQVGQHLKAWVVPPPKVKTRRIDGLLDSEITNE